MTLDDLIPIEADPKPLAVFAMPVLPDIPDATYWIIIYRATTEDTPQPSDIEALRGAVWLDIEQAKAMATEPQGIGELIDRGAEIISTASGSPSYSTSAVSAPSSRRFCWTRWTSIPAATAVASDD